MDVILHLGAHRCATTTLQKYLLHNETALADAGVVAWGPRITRAGRFSGLVQRPRAVTPEIARRGLRSCGVMSMEIQELAKAGYRELIISDENMIGSVRCNLEDKGLYAEAIPRLSRFVAGVGGDPRRIGICLRSYDKYWASALGFGVTRGHPFPDAVQLGALVAQQRTWRDLIADVATVFPRSEIVVWPFERFAGQPDKQLTMLTDGLHISPGLSRNREWFNRSPGRAELRDILQSRETNRDMPMGLDGEGGWMPFTADQQGKMRADYTADLEWLRAGADGMARFVEDVTPSKQKTIMTRGFIRSDRTWTAPQGGRTNDNEKIVV